MEIILKVQSCKLELGTQCLLSYIWNTNQYTFSSVFCSILCRQLRLMKCKIWRFCDKISYFIVTFILSPLFCRLYFIVTFILSSLSCRLYFNVTFILSPLSCRLYFIVAFILSPLSCRLYFIVTFTLSPLSCRLYLTKTVRLWMGKKFNLTKKVFNVNWGRVHIYIYSVLLNWWNHFIKNAWRDKTVKMLWPKL